MSVDVIGLLARGYTREQIADYQRAVDEQAAQDTPAAPEKPARVHSRRKA